MNLAHNLPYLSPSISCFFTITENVIFFSISDCLTLLEYIEINLLFYVNLLFLSCDLAKLPY